MPLFDFAANLEVMRTGFSDKRSITLPARPVWMKDNDILANVYKELPELTAGANVYYAGIARANSILYAASPGTDAVAYIVIGTSDYYNKNPEVLARIGADIIKFKDGRNIVPELAVFIRAVGDRERIINLPLPDILTGGKPAYLTTICVNRAFLPKRRLIAPVFPVVSAPDICGSSVILPETFWTRDFRIFYNGTL